MDLVGYLGKLGFNPTRVTRSDYWYLSPLREEKNASFKVNRKLNLWFDHGTGKGGNLVDFGIAFFHCSVKEFLSRMDSVDFDVSFHPPNAGEKKKKSELANESKISILSALEITSAPLLQYLKKRNVDAEIARRFCKEVLFKLYNKNYRVIGFENNSGGYELRSEIFKGSSAPKDIRLIPGTPQKTERKNLLVFEGFFNFLSFKTLEQKQSFPDGSLTNKQNDFLILNSLSFFEKTRQLMEGYGSVHLFLDRDKQGMKFKDMALIWSGKYKDESHFYKQYKDLNEYLTKESRLVLKQGPRPGRHF